MLSELIVKNVALIDYAQLSFSQGLNILSGETGAGKSVLLDSVNFVLGAKADKSMIRYGEDECMVKAEFLVAKDSRAARVLDEMDIESDGVILISRRFSVTGKNSIKVNGNTVTAAMLKKITSCLVDVHGQSEHFYLLSEANQLKTLDGVAGEKAKAIKERLSRAIAEKKAIDEKIAMLGGDVRSRGRRLDVLKFEIEEIETANLKDGEEEELLEKRDKINNLEKILTAVKESSESLSSDGGVSDGIRRAKRALGVVARLDKRYEEICERLENLSAEADDVAETLAEFGQELYFDDNEAEETERRLDEIRSLKRKYGATKKEIEEYLQKSREEYDLLSDCEGQYSECEKKRKKVLANIYECCTDLTLVRRNCAKAFCVQVEEELKTLNIRSARFEAAFSEYSEADAERAGENGLDDMRFMFSANVGEPLKPLNKVISGGEMSRLMLAIKARLTDAEGISTYVFDEIDSGISGKTAKVVGEKFADIAKATQIIAVSHQAQIAAMSDREFLIEKKERDGKTYSSVRILTEEEKSCEIVRLLGGEAGDEIARQHAEALIAQANEYKKSV